MAFDPTGFSISISDRDGRSVVVIRGELDLATAPELEAALRAPRRGREVVVDLRELAFMDSTGSASSSPPTGTPRTRDERFVIVRPLAGGADGADPRDRGRGERARHGGRGYEAGGARGR